MQPLYMWFFFPLDIHTILVLDLTGVSNLVVHVYF